eukprot:m.131501 g.131501  ORF g.131501 m.131501 type:complete len:570 (+) comp11314_c0_seq2:385-2094(+)
MGVPKAAGRLPDVPTHLSFPAPLRKKRSATELKYLAKHAASTRTTPALLSRCALPTGEGTIASADSATIITLLASHWKVSEAAVRTTFCFGGQAPSVRALKAAALCACGWTSIKKVSASYPRLQFPESSDEENPTTGESDDQEEMQESAAPAPSGPGEPPSMVAALEEAVATFEATNVPPPASLLAKLQKAKTQAAAPTDPDMSTEELQRERQKLVRAIALADGEAPPAMSDRLEAVKTQLHLREATASSLAPAAKRARTVTVVEPSSPDPDVSSQLAAMEARLMAAVSAQTQHSADDGKGPRHRQHFPSWTVSGGRVAASTFERTSALATTDFDKAFGGEFVNFANASTRLSGGGRPKSYIVGSVDSSTGEVHLRTTTQSGESRTANAFRSLPTSVWWSVFRGWRAAREQAARVSDPDRVDDFEQYEQILRSIETAYRESAPTAFQAYDHRFRLTASAYDGQRTVDGTLMIPAWDALDNTLLSSLVGTAAPASALGQSSLDEGETRTHGAPPPAKAPAPPKTPSGLRCRFFNRETGCKKGTGCDRTHACSVCGSRDHAKPACPDRTSE